MKGSTRAVDYLPIKEAAKFLTERTGRKFKKLDIFQEARNGHITLSAELLSAAKCNHGRVEALISMPGHKITYGEAPRSQRISGVLDLWAESSQIFEIVDGELQIGRDDTGNALPEGLHFKTNRLHRIVELLNADGTKAKKLPKDARWVVRRSSLERYLNPIAAPAEDETFQSSVQAYRSLEWLTLEQAADWIEIISGSAVEDSYLYAMAEFGNCSMYVDTLGLEGQTEVKYRPLPQQTVRGLGICQVVTPLVAAGQDTYLCGPVEFIGGHDDGWQEQNCSWRISPAQDYEPLFKPAEIEEIARMTVGPGRWSSQASAVAGSTEAPHAAKPAGECTAENPCDSGSLESAVGHFAEQNLLRAMPVTGVAKHKPKGQLQEDAIIKALEDRGHTASALPVFKPGVRSVKAEVRDALLQTRKDLFVSSGTFEKAWEGLRATGKVGNQA